MRTDSQGAVMTYDHWNPYVKPRKWTGTFNYTATRRDRSDPRSTAPLNGVFFTPTGYYARIREYKPGTANNSDWGYTPAIVDPLYTYGNALAVIQPPDGELGNLVNSAKASLSDQQANWGESLGELKGTTGMVVNGLLTAVKVTNALRDRDPMAAVRALNLSASKISPNGHKAIRNINRGSQAAKDVSDFYLATIFGWKPLIDDIATAVDLLEGKLSTQRTQGSTIIGVSSSSHSEPNVDGSYYHGPAGRGDVLITRKWSARCKLFYRFNHSTTLQKLERFGLGNPLRTAWNLTPMSFLVDTVLPVGDMLSSLTSTSGLTFLNGFISTKAELHSSVVRTTGAGYNNRWMREFPSYHETVFQRHIAGGFTKAPSFRLPFKGYTNARDLDRAVTLAALAAQRAPRL